MTNVDKRFNLHNHTEDLVSLVIKRIFREQPSMCQCADCKRDIALISLNQLPTLYSRPTDRPIVSVEDVSQDLLLKAMAVVYRSARKVNENPRHDGDPRPELHNYTEDFVLEMLDEVVAQREGQCTCDSCLEKILELSLEQLPPKYVSTTKGQAYMRVDQLDSRFVCTLLAALYDAFNKVKASPVHK